MNMTVSFVHPHFRSHNSLEAENQLNMIEKVFQI